MVISAYKRWLCRTLAELAELAEQAGLDRPEEVGYALLLLIDGANARVVVDDDRTAMLRAKATAAMLIGVADA
ncbi:hypothetical protein [Nonomuraea sp. NPDC050643]|uniref:hypothetical protein n=1 Tax=Nonomuraea sp. NPDC050643 TaxID=3155660 RepID=UPI0033E250FA